jgi:hypothetical protein
MDDGRWTMDDGRWTIEEHSLLAATAVSQHICRTLRHPVILSVAKDLRCWLDPVLNVQHDGTR